MRTHVLGCLLLAVGGSQLLAVEPAKRVATVDIDGVEIRSGNALAYPSVGKLRKGDTVIVIREEDTNFLAIQPPPGSLSWIKGIHLGKVELGANNKANVPVTVEGADVAAGSDLVSGPSSRITLQVARGTIVEIIAAPVRVDNATWYPITPPDGDLRWIPKTSVKASSLVSLAPPPIYNRPDPPAYSVGDGPKPPEATPTPRTPAANAGLPPILTSHKLWAQATQAEQSRDYATAKALYARIYHDLWEQKAEREAIVICYNRHNRCDEMLKGERPPASRTESRRPTAERTETATPRTTPTAPARPAPQWSGPGLLQEVPRVFVDGLQVYSLIDDRGQVLYYTTSSTMNLKNYHGRRVDLYGVVSQKPTLYRPHIAIERLEAVK